MSKYDPAVLKLQHGRCVVMLKTTIALSGKIQAVIRKINHTGQPISGKDISINNKKGRTVSGDKYLILVRI